MKRIIKRICRKVEKHYHTIKNIMIASACATFYYQSITNIPKGTVLLGTACIFAAVLVLISDADKLFANAKDRQKTCQEKKMSA